MKILKFLFLSLLLGLFACKKHHEGNRLVRTQKDGNLYGEYSYNAGGKATRIHYHEDHNTALIYKVFYTGNHPTRIKEYFDGSLFKTIDINWNDDFPVSIGIYQNVGNDINIQLGNDGTHLTYAIIADGNQIRRFNFIWSGEDISRIKLYYQNGNQWVFMRRYDYQYDNKKHSRAEVLIGTNGQYDDPLLWVHLFSAHNVTREGIYDSSGNSLGSFNFDYTYGGNGYIKSMSAGGHDYDFEYE